MRFINSLARAILQREEYPQRFEQFSLDIYHAFTGIRLLPTSKSWDLARDGVRNIIGEQEAYYLCATTAQGWEKKVLSEVERLQSILARLSGRNCGIIITLNADISEFTAEGLKARINGLAPNVGHIEVIYLTQLAKLSADYQDVFLQYYRAEYEDAREMLDKSDFDEMEIEKIGLHIALSTELQDDATLLRRELLCYLVLSVLDKNNDLTCQDIAIKVGCLLHLDRSLGPAMLQSELQQLLDSKHIEPYAEQKFRITSTGKAKLADRDYKGAERLLEGRRIFKEALSTLAGDGLLPEDFDLVWKKVQEAIADLFYSRGLHISKVLSALIGTKNVQVSENDFREIIGSVADDVAGLLAPHMSTSRVSDIRQAIIDIFYGINSPAFEWLSSLCAVYISLLSLGLEPSAALAIKDQLKKMNLLLDTDVVLSYLCEGEKHHTATKLVLRKWLQIGGVLMCPNSVLAEATHHAWNAEYEFAIVGRYLHEYTDQAALCELDNAFVRAFRKLAGGKYDPKIWSKYMQNYRGVTEDDTSRISSILHDELNCSVFDENNRDDSLSHDFADYIFELRKPESDAPPYSRTTHQLREKSDRDGILLASVAQTRSVRDPSAQLYVVVSSSMSMERAAAHFANRLGDPFPVLTWSGITYLVSFIPEAKLHLGSVRGCLFDVAVRQKVLPIEQLAFNAMRRLGIEGFGFSRRFTLRKTMQKSLVEIAKQEGLSPKQMHKSVREVFEKPADHSSKAAEVITSAISQLTSPKAEIELAKAKKKIEEMAMEILLLRDSLKTHPGQLDSRSVYSGHHLPGHSKPARDTKIKK